MPAAVYGGRATQRPSRSHERLVTPLGVLIYIYVLCCAKKYTPSHLLIPPVTSAHFKLSLSHLSPSTLPLTLLSLTHRPPSPIWVRGRVIRGPHPLIHPLTLNPQTPSLIISINPPSSHLQAPRTPLGQGAPSHPYPPLTSPLTLSL